jgi:competence protein ComGC
LKLSAKTKRHNSGFTLIEMVIVLLILSVLLAIAIPSVMHARADASANGCMANLWEIEGAEQRWAMENRKESTETPTKADLCPDHIKHWPECPDGGTYTLQTIDQPPLCSVGGTHQIK